MREVLKLIERGSKKAGGQDKFALVIGIHPNSLSSVKAGRRSLPPHAIEAAAEYLGEDKISLAGRIFLEWKRVAACLILGLSSAAISTNDLEVKMTSVQQSDIYIMRNILRLDQKLGAPSSWLPTWYA